MRIAVAVGPRCKRKVVVTQPTILQGKHSIDTSSWLRKCALEYPLSLRPSEHDVHGYVSIGADSERHSRLRVPVPSRGCTTPWVHTYVILRVEVVRRICMVPSSSLLRERAFHLRLRETSEFNVIRAAVAGKGHGNDRGSVIRLLGKDTSGANAPRTPCGWSRP